VAAIAGCGIPQGDLIELPQDGPRELPQDTQDQFNAALSVIRSISAGNFEEAIDNFDSEMKISWPPEKLEVTWVDLVARFGEFDSIGLFGDSERGDAEPGESVVYVSCEFEDGGCTVWIALNSNNQVSDIEFEEGEQTSIEELVPEHSDSALSLIRTMAEGNFDAAFEKFNADMKKYMPLEKLKTNWNNLETQYGPFEDTEVFDGRSFRYDADRIESMLFIRCIFERGETTIDVLIDPDNQITALVFAERDPQAQ
jgi:hypothetical protein